MVCLAITTLHLLLFYAGYRVWDCRVASLLAMTGGENSYNDRKSEVFVIARHVENMSFHLLLFIPHYLNIQFCCVSSEWQSHSFIPTVLLSKVIYDSLVTKLSLWFLAKNLWIKSIFLFACSKVIFLKT